MSNGYCLLFEFDRDELAEGRAVSLSKKVRSSSSGLELDRFGPLLTDCGNVATDDVPAGIRCRVLELQRFIGDLAPRSEALQKNISP